MAIVSVGYPPTVNTTTFALLLGNAGTDYYVDGDSWAATPAAGTPFGVKLSAGSGGGYGVRDVSDGGVADVVIGTEPAAGSEWWTIFARRDWQTGQLKTTFVMLKGTAAQAIAASRQTNPGVIDDQPLWLVRFTKGSTVPTALVDLRVWRGNGGGFVARDVAVTGYLTEVGTRVLIGAREYVRRWSASLTPEWVSQEVGDRPRPRTYKAVRGGSDSWTGWGNLIGVTLPVDAPSGLYLVQGRALVGFNGSSQNQAWEVTKRFVGVTDAVQLGEWMRDDHSGGVLFECKMEDTYELGAGSRVNYQVHSTWTMSVFPPTRITATFLG